MMHGEMQLAPRAEMVRYLAVFCRFFRATQGYAASADCEGMLLGGYLADALHNVPSVLWRYGETNWHKPAAMGDWIERFPQAMVRRGMPEPLVATCEEIVSNHGTAEELGLRPDLADLDLAPPMALGRYLNVLYHACLDMRTMRNFGGRPPAIWDGLVLRWTEESGDCGRLNGLLTTALEDLPFGLVHWGQFVEENFWRRVKDLALGVSEDRHTDWIALLGAEGC